jgi:hypothetical protein
MVRRNRFVMWTTVAALLACATVAYAQTASAPTLDSATLRTRLASWAAPDTPLPADRTDLDAMLAHKQYAELKARLASASDPDQVFLNMNWERLQVYNGAGFLVSYLYMKDAWRLGSGLGGKGEGIKQTAAAFYLYNLMLTAVDGERCADSSAPAHRHEQLIEQSADLIAYLRGLSKADRAKVGTVALAIESMTWPVRTNDNVLCSGGLDELTQGLKAQGDKPLREVPNAPGMLGKTYVVPAPSGGAEPRFVSAEAAAPRMAAARASLAGELNRYLLLSLPDARATGGID